MTLKELSKELGIFSVFFVKEIGASYEKFNENEIIGTEQVNKIRKKQVALKIKQERTLKKARVFLENNEGFKEYLKSINISKKILTKYLGFRQENLCNIIGVSRQASQNTKLLVYLTLHNEKSIKEMQEME